MQKNNKRYSLNSARYGRGGRHRIGEPEDRLGLPQKIQEFRIDKAVQALKGKISELGIGNGELNLFIGTGQYFHKPDHDRIIVLNSKSALNDFCGTQLPHEKSDFVELLLDCSLNSADIDNLTDELDKVANTVCSGEVNAVDEGSWTHGFAIGDELKIFSQNSLLCKLSGLCFQIAAGNDVEQLLIDDIESVRITLSEEPWNDQDISLECRDDIIVELLNLSYENDYRDLAMLMVDTEWCVKAAALLCLNLRKLGHKSVQLKLPKVLTVQGNPWVENRHNLWTRFSNSK